MDLKFVVKIDCYQQEGKGRNLSLSHWSDIKIISDISGFGDEAIDRAHKVLAVREMR